MIGERIVLKVAVLEILGEVKAYVIDGEQTTTRWLLFDTVNRQHRMRPGFVYQVEMFTERYKRTSVKMLKPLTTWRRKGKRRIVVEIVPLSDSPFIALKLDCYHTVLRYKGATKKPFKSTTCEECQKIETGMANSETQKLVSAGEAWG